MYKVDNSVSSSSPILEISSGKGNGFILLENLSKSFREGSQLRNVLVDVSAEIFPGEFIAVLGRSGSGKSTLLNLISGIDRPDSGKIVIKGQEITRMDDAALTRMRRKNIGFVFQFFNLLPTLTIQENVALPLELNNTPSGLTVQKVHDALDSVGLLDRKETYPEKLSGGEQQRVAIARALVHDPELVLADEPTGNLDEATGWMVLELLDRLTRQSGKNLILVTHNTEAAKGADRVFRLVEGRFFEE
jgi:putative ABC transport system ATP-binding protein